jgi:hypothetical protein
MNMLFQNVETPLGEEYDHGILLLRSCVFCLDVATKFNSVCLFICKVGKGCCVMLEDIKWNLYKT